MYFITILCDLFQINITKIIAKAISTTIYAPLINCTKEAAKNAPKAAPQSEAPAQIKYVPLPAPFLHSYPGVVGEDALPYIDPAPKAGDRIEGSATFDGKAVDFKVDCLG